MPGTDTGVVHIRQTRIFEEKHIADKAIEAVADPEAILVSPALEGHAHFLLGIVFCLQVVEAIAARDEEMFLHIADMKSEETLQHTVVDEGTRKEVFTERQSEVFYLPRSHRQRGREMSEKSEKRILWDLPDAEEAQYMVDPDGVEVLLHPAQSFPEPPRQTYILLSSDSCLLSPIS